MNRTRQTGFSLIELLVAMTISLIILLALVSTFVNSNNAYSELTKTSKQIENGRYAIELLTNDIQLGGFFGEFTGTPASSVVPPSPCVISAAEFADSPDIGIYGLDGGAAAPLPCLPNYKPGTDVLVIRRAGTLPVGGALDAAAIYVQGLGNALHIRDGAATFGLTYNTLALPGGAVPVYPYVEHIYFVATCSRCGANSNAIPTLHRLELNGTNFSDVPLVEGIEDLQLRYGLDQPGTTGSPTVYRSVNEAPLSLADWANVVSVEVNVLARNTESTRRYVDRKSYTLVPGVTTSYNDDFRRHAFASVVFAFNQAARKEWNATP